MDNEELVVQKSSLEEYQTEDIKNLIYTIRGKQVMLDSDVARLYQYETKNINKAMKRNIEKWYCNPSKYKHNKSVYRDEKIYSK